MRRLGRSASPLPLYFTAMMEIREDILAGRWMPGARIPGELALARRLGVSVVTIREALARLVGEGYLERERAKGTFVSANRPTRESVDLEAGSNDLLTLGRTGTSFRVMSIQESAACPEIRRKLQLGRGGNVARIVRMRLSHGRPLARVVSHVPWKFASSIAQARLERIPLHILVEEAAGVRFTEVRHRVAARIADEAVARDLEIPAGSPVLRVARDYLEKRATLLSSVGSYRSDLYDYALTLRCNTRRPVERKAGRGGES